MYLTIDIGGSKTLLATFTNKGQKKETVKFPTPRSYANFKNKVSDSVASFTTRGFVAAGIAAPGKIDRRTGKVLAFGNLPWGPVPMKKDLEEIINCPLLIENDANLAGLSEAHLLRGQYNKVLYVTISTGIGGGYIINGSIDKDTQDMEIGHVPLEHQGTTRKWEDFASGKAIYNKYGKPISDIKEPKILQEIAQNIAVGLINSIMTLTPDIIVIGGGASKYYGRYKKYLEEELARYEDSMVTVPPVIAAHRPDEAVIYGCFEAAKKLA